MPSGYTAPSSFAFFIKEVGKGKGSSGGTVAVPVNPVGGDTHIPFNPMESMGFTNPVWKQIKAILMGEIVESTFTPGSMEDGKQSLKDVFYHAPFIMAKIFPKKTLGAWAADLTATLDMTAGLSDFVGTPETICTHVHIDDKADSPNDIDVNLFGGMVEEYAWVFKTGDCLKEEAEIRYSNVQAGAIAFNSAATFHNQRYAMWNDTWISDSKVVSIPFNAITISTYTNMDAAIKIKGGSFRIKIPRTSEAYFGSSGTSGFAESDIRNHLEVIVELDCDIINDEVYTEELAKFAARTDATPKVMWTSGAFYEYLQCTKMKLDPTGDYEIPKVKDSPLFTRKLKFIMSSDSVLSFKGTYDQSEVPVPTNYV